MDKKKMRNALKRAFEAGARQGLDSGDKAGLAKVASDLESGAFERWLDGPWGTMLWAELTTSRKPTVEATYLEDLAFLQKELEAKGYGTDEWAPRRGEARKNMHHRALMNAAYLVWTDEDPKNSDIGAQAMDVLEFNLLKVTHPQWFEEQETVTKKLISDAPVGRDYVEEEVGIWLHRMPTGDVVLTPDTPDNPSDRTIVLRTYKKGSRSKQIRDESRFLGRDMEVVDKTHHFYGRVGRVKAIMQDKYSLTFHSVRNGVDVDSWLDASQVKFLQNNLERTPEGSVNNCAVANGYEQAECQVCHGRATGCPDMGLSKDSFEGDRVPVFRRD